MTSIIEVRSIDAKYVGTDLLRRLRSVVPCNYTGFYDAVLSEDDPRWPLLRNELDKAGLRPWDYTGTPNRSTQYDLSYRLAYEPSDMQHAPYVRLHSPNSLLVDEWIDGWQPVLVEFDSEILSSRDFAWHEDWYLLSDRVRRAWEPMKPAGLGFRPVRLWHKDGMDQWDRVGGPWWLMEFAVKLPPPLPPVPEQERYFNADHRYAASTIAAAGPFDAALAPYRNSPCSYFPVISKRMFDTCIANNFKADWYPVWVEEG